ncbi:MAG: DUF1080 domain-containing protein [Planctomycetes bacterium]|nr:DUF1080 domain-containing protein [Planctomycetota bacterium]
MKMKIIFLCLFILSAGSGLVSGNESKQGWISLFDGTLNDWKAGENKASFTVDDGVIVANGQRSHLFYVGPVENAIFTDFELKVDVMTKSGSNGGIYFHTEFQQNNWPDKGFEVQVNNTYNRDPKKTGSLYMMSNVTKKTAGDDVWFTEHIIVKGKRVIIKIDDKKVVDWTEDDPPRPPSRFSKRVLSSGTFALQGHDPGSTVYYKNIRVRPLPVIDFPLVDYHVHLKGGLTLEEALRMSKKRGVKFGIAQNCGLGFNVTDDNGLKDYLEKLKGKSVYVAMQAEGREWLGLFSPEWIAKFDYVFSDAMTFTDDSGRRTRLWIKEEVNIGDKQQFMDMLVRKTVGILNNEPIDIYVNPTFLPAEIADEYDDLWTRQRMMKVIEAAVRNDVAIEINARYKIPSAEFIKLAKKAGAKFALGTNNGGKDLGNLEYCRRMIRQYRLKESDFFKPRPPGKRAIDRWKSRR